MTIVFFFLCFNQEKIFQMAKYLDQAGAQHLAEALMNSTKTVGGQTIWGSGNINTDDTTIIISSMSDLKNNLDLFLSPQYKSILFKANTFDLAEISGSSINIQNATVIGPDEDSCVIFVGGSMTFYNCIFTIGSPTYISTSNAEALRSGARIYFYGMHISFIQCKGIFEHDPDLNQGVVFHGSELDLYYSDISIASKNNVAFNSNTTPNARIGTTIMQNSSISGFTFRGMQDTTTTQLTLYPLNSSSRAVFIVNHIISCDLSYIVITSDTSMSGSASKVIKNTEFKYCAMPMTNVGAKIMNVTHCMINPMGNQCCVDGQGLHACGTEADGGFCSQY